MNKPNINRITDTENILTIATLERGLGKTEKGEGIKKYKLIVTE